MRAANRDAKRKGVGNGVRSSLIPFRKSARYCHFLAYRSIQGSFREFPASKFHDISMKVEPKPPDRQINGCPDIIDSNAEDKLPGLTFAWTFRGGDE